MCSGEHELQKKNEIAASGGMTEPKYAKKIAIEL